MKNYQHAAKNNMETNYNVIKHSISKLKLPTLWQIITKFLPVNIKIKDWHNHILNEKSNNFN